MQNEYEFNSLEFITKGGVVSMTVAIILLVMSVSSWYLIVTKSVQMLRLRAAFKAYTQNFGNAPNLTSAVKQEGNIALANLVKKSIAAAEHHQQYAHKINGDDKKSDLITEDEYIARAMNRSITEESAKMENGLTVLASVGSVSPFVGLFGTVWGIYHALASISQSGQATLDRVAGPVGEALIMTSLGLAVAIPAVLAYNALVRINRMLVGQIEHFAYELHALLVTGTVIHVKTNPNRNSKEKTQQKERVYAVEVPA